MDDLHIRADVQHIELHRPFHSIEVVVKAGFRPHKERRGDTGQGEHLGKFPFKGVLRKLDRDFCLQDIQLGKIIGGKNQVFVRHGSSSFQNPPAGMPVGSISIPNKPILYFSIPMGILQENFVGINKD